MATSVNDQHTTNYLRAVMPWKTIAGYDRLSINPEEEDNFVNNFYSESFDPSQWHIPETCRAYKVRLSIPVKPGVSKTDCWTVSGEIEAEYKGANGGASTSYNSCSSWEDPAQSLVFGVEVKTPGYDAFGVAQYCGGGKVGEGSFYGVCADGRCCSKWGWCGTGSDWCNNPPTYALAGFVQDVSALK